MIVTLTVHPAIDLGYRAKSITPGPVHHAVDSNARAGGKGINVSRMLNLLGHDTLALAPIGGITGQWFHDLLSAEEFRHQVIKTDSETRINIVLASTANGREIKVNTDSSPLTEKDIANLDSALLYSMQDAGYVCFCGSLPPGAKENLYADFIQKCRRNGITSVLDSSGLSLSNGLSAGPDIIKPNLMELESLYGKPFISHAQAAEFARSLLNDQTKIIAVTLGEMGAFLVSREGSWQADAPPIQTGTAAMGAGDAFLAGLLSYLETDQDMPQSLKLAVACGTAVADCPAGEPVPPSLIDEMLTKVQISEL